MTNNPADADLAREDQLEANVERLKRAVTLLQDRIDLLEQENGELAAMLKERGVNTHSSSKTALELPPALTAPWEQNAEIRTLMTPSEQRLLDEVRGGAPLIVLLKSDSVTDTGAWLRKGRIWIAATTTDLILLADGRKPFFQKIPFAYLRESLYNHVTGELVLAPNRGWKLDHVALPPLAGYQLLAQIYTQQTQGEKP